MKAFVGAFLTLLATGLLAPGSARADCGHPVERPGIGLDAFRTLESPATPTPPPKPCSGPSCSNKSAPPTSTVTPPAPRAELWGILAEAPPVVEVPSNPRATEEALERPIRPANAIFHPPRSPR